MGKIAQHIQEIYGKAIDDIPPMVSVIIPCRNEEKFIDVCLDSILANDYPKDRLEILVVDGMSEDGTRTTVQNYARNYPFTRLLDNPKKITPAALNIGIANAKGEIIMRMDAHSTYRPDYISGLVDWLEETNADNVGGVCMTVPATQNCIAEAIALALSHPFGVGNAYFRIGIKEPRWVDTVPFGCYRKQVFDRIGVFDEELVRNQDDEFNLRLIRHGGRILLIPEIISYYVCRGTLGQLWHMYFQYGFFKPLVIRKVGSVLTVRQVIPTLFLLSMLAMGLLSLWSVHARTLFGAIIVIYLLADIVCSMHLAYRRKFKLAPALCLVFPVLHFSYGLGFLRGILDFLIIGRRWRKDAANISITK